MASSKHRIIQLFDNVVRVGLALDEGMSDAYKAGKVFISVSEDILTLAKENGVIPYKYEGVFVPVVSREADGIELKLHEQ